MVVLGTDSHMSPVMVSVMTFPTQRVPENWDAGRFARR